MYLVCMYNLVHGLLVRLQWEYISIEVEKGVKDVSTVDYMQFCGLVGLQDSDV